MPPTRTSRTKTIGSAAALLAALALGAAAQAAPIPPSGTRGRPAEWEGALRAFLHSGPWEPMGELDGRLVFEGRQPAHDLMLGSYYRAHEALKLGGFLRFQSGVRHDDDWVSPVKGTWLWRGVQDRTEPVMVLDATPRAELTALPGGPWLGAVKARFEHDFFDGEEVLRLEPELSWFYMEGLSPLAHVTLRYERALYLNFGERKVGEQWVYLSAFWHGPDGFVAGPHVAVGEQVFTTSKSFASAGGGSYVIFWKSMRLGLDAVWRF